MVGQGVRRWCKPIITPQRGVEILSDLGHFSGHRERPLEVTPFPLAQNPRPVPLSHGIIPRQGSFDRGFKAWSFGSWSFWKRSVLLFHYQKLSSPKARNSNSVR